MAKKKLADLRRDLHAQCRDLRALDVTVNYVQMLALLDYINELEADASWEHEHSDQTI
jgi:hypothetical protein